MPTLRYRVQTLAYGTETSFSMKKAAARVFMLMILLATAFRSVS